MPRPRPLHSQVVVITGASSGVGRSTALHLGSLGATVVLTSRRGRALCDLAERISRAGGRALAVPADVCRESELEAVADAAIATYGRIDTWINGAAVFIQGRVEDTTLEEYRRLLEVNLLGVIAGTRIALARMRPNDAGTIIQLSSIVAERAAPMFSAYTASKAAVDHFTDALRVELYGSRIQVCTVHLQQTDTPIYRHARGKLGTIPKPPPFVMDPAAVAREIARLAERPKPHRTLGAFGRVYARLIRKVPVALSDWIVYRGAGLTRTASPSLQDNLDAPMQDVPRERDGWRPRAWPGVAMLKEAVITLPVELVLGVAAIGFGQGRVHRWLRSRDPIATGAARSARREIEKGLAERNESGRARNASPGAAPGERQRSVHSSDAGIAVGDLSRAMGQSGLVVPPPSESGA